MPISTAGNPASSQRGFTYVMVLVAIVVIGILVEAAHETTWHIVQADREAELIFRGLAYRGAIESFYKANGSYPREIEDLVKDPRAASRRHLRALYSDPMASGEKKEWLLVRAKDGGIAGVASTSAGEPLRKANFPIGLEKLASAKSYKDWIFEYVAPPVQPQRPPAALSPPAAPPAVKTF